MLVKIAEK